MRIKKDSIIKTGDEVTDFSLSPFPLPKEEKSKKVMHRSIFPSKFINKEGHFWGVEQQSQILCKLP